MTVPIFTKISCKNILFIIPIAWPILFFNAIVHFVLHIIVFTEDLA